MTSYQGQRETQKDGDRGWERETIRLGLAPHGQTGNNGANEY